MNMTDFLTKLDKARGQNTDLAKSHLIWLLYSHADEIAELVRAAKKLRELKRKKELIEKGLASRVDIAFYDTNKEATWAELDEALAALNKEKS